ncbi:MAG TPA: hypothetical protein VLI04_02395 [Nocardioidaceae bacterium]|nr:hypothetical protein [Nocardioidaceae bacterium]
MNLATTSGRAVLCAAAALFASMGLQGQASADPPGNNGTVKIASEGDIDEIPDNEPHQGCSFTVQWYNFDEGADVISTVGFSLQAPTKGPDFTMEVDGLSSVFVGADGASGAGNDPDGEEIYVLTFTGDPHPQQGYHVKLVVHTPHSKGADRKSKVFWVEGCAPPPTPTDTPTVTPTETTPATTTPTSTETPTVLGTETTGPGELPTEVDAGMADGTGSGNTGAVLLVLAGLGLGAGALLLIKPRGRHQF